MEGDPGCHEEFRMAGNWWVPDRPEGRVAGTLGWSPKGATLDLAGAFADRSWPPVEYPIIHGTTGMGRCVTLCDCTQKSLRKEVVLDEGRSNSEERISAPWALVGLHLGGAGSVAFRSVRAELTMLDQWVGVSGFDLGSLYSGGGGPHRMTYKNPDNEVHAAGDAEVEIMFGYVLEPTNRPLTRLRMEQRCAVEVRPRAEFGLGGLAGRVLGLRRLVSLAMLRPSVPVHVVAEVAERCLGGSGEDVGATVRVYGGALVAGKTPPPGPSGTSDYRGVPLPYGDVRAGFGDLYARWSRAQETLALTLRLYFGTVSDAGMHPEEQALNLIRAAESFHKRHVRRAPLALRARLKSLLRMFPEVAHDCSAEDLAGSAVRVRNHMSHGGREDPPDEMRPERLDAIRDKMAVLVEACLLHAAGIGAARIGRFARRSLCTKNPRLLADMRDVVTDEDIVFGMPATVVSRFVQSGFSRAGEGRSP